MRASPPFYLLAALVAGCAQQTPASRSPGSPEAVVPRIAELFSVCELDALVGRYVPTAEFISPSTPKPLVGREALREYFAGACKGTVRPVMKVESQRVKSLTPGAVVVTGTYSFGRTDRPNDKPWPAFFVITATSEGGDWLINSQATFPIPE
ncbi:uncharacterized protein with a cystatin-like fold [Burkholderiales bacterium JOSHI_001]|nr:uncharacterized protein with a cystatin-like fold [Burkholderiales bacterium JOSHI_001]